MPNSIIPHPPNELETKDIAELGERTAHPFPHPEPTDKQPPGERPQHRHRPAAPIKQAGPANQGEGDRVSARVYEDHLHDFISTGQVERAARDAARAVDGPERDELHAAEERGKQPARLSLLDRVSGLVRHVRTAIRQRRARG
jgi:hypothetical protein